MSFLKRPERVAKLTTTHSHQSKDTEVKEVIEKEGSEEVASTLKKLISAPNYSVIYI